MPSISVRVWLSTRSPVPPASLDEPPQALAIESKFIEEYDAGRRRARLVEDIANVPLGFTKLHGKQFRSLRNVLLQTWLLKLTGSLRSCPWLPYATQYRN